MEVQKLTLENVQKLKSESYNALVKRVCRYVISNWKFYDDKKRIFLDIINDGCKNGACRDLICYGQTTKFYDDFKHEIGELVHGYGYNNLMDLFGSDWDPHDPLAADEDNQNLLAWFGFEETLINIARKFGIED